MPAPERLERIAEELEVRARAPVQELTAQL
jgi:hypothetical protein